MIAETKTVRAYVTKYALTSGIQELDLEPSDGGYAYDTGRYRTQYCRGEWHLAKSDAMAAAEAMRMRKIASLQRQVAKLEAMKFPT